MKKNVCFTFLALAIIIAFTSCTKTNPSSDNIHPITLPVNGLSVVGANNKFAFDFLRSTLQLDTSNSNKLISPLSIYLALSMVYNGADNATKDSISNALQLSGIDINTLNTFCQSLITQLPAEDSKVKLSIANSIWYRSTLQPLPSFLNITKNLYQASTEALDFNDPNSVNTINDWVAQNTNNKIQKVINATTPDDLMYLINAIYFNGTWQHGFNTTNTHTDNFYLQNGTIAAVPFMEQRFTTMAYSDSVFSLIELPYGSGNSFSMYISIPNNQQQPISTFASLMNENILANAISKMDSANVDLDIPKWEYAYSIDDMRPGLSMLGMGIAFTGNADFGKMYDITKTQVSITKATHKTYIKVNEEGTEAAAVTTIGMGTTSSIPSPAVKLNHPFLYSIVEKQTGVVLFAGIVNDPSVN